MGLPANKNYHNKIKLLNQTFHMQQAGLPTNKILSLKTFGAPISYAMGLKANKIISIKTF